MELLAVLIVIGLAMMIDATPRAEAVRVEEIRRR
jgi:hypothetical protein